MTCPDILSVGDQIRAAVLLLAFFGMGVMVGHLVTDRYFRRQQINRLEQK